MGRLRCGLSIGMAVAKRGGTIGTDSVTNGPSSVQPGRPPRPILNAFFLPRGLLGCLGGRLMARGLRQRREIADLLSNPGTNLCEIGCGPGVTGPPTNFPFPTPPATPSSPSTI